MNNEKRLFNPLSMSLISIHLSLAIALGSNDEHLDGVEYVFLVGAGLFLVVAVFANIFPPDSVDRNSDSIPNESKEYGKSMASFFVAQAAALFLASTGIVVGDEERWIDALYRLYIISLLPLVVLFTIVAIVLCHRIIDSRSNGAGTSE